MVILCMNNLNPKTYQNWRVWLENEPSGNPGSHCWTQATEIVRGSFSNGLLRRETPIGKKSWEVAWFASESAKVNFARKKSETGKVLSFADSQQNARF
jgi:hypothetical protein